jgi:hypothetical protein
VFDLRSSSINKEGLWSLWETASARFPKDLWETPVCGVFHRSGRIPYLPFIRDTLAQYPRLRATRLFEMVKGRGYTGSVVQLRRSVRLIRPAATATVFRRLTTLAAEEAQIDWGTFGSIGIGRGVRPLSGFVMVQALMETEVAGLILGRSGTSAARPSSDRRRSVAPVAT